MFTIEDLSLGKCAVINDGTVEELREVLKLAFPNARIHPSVNLRCGRIYTRGINHGDWICRINTYLPIQSAKDFLTKELKRGDLVWVSDNDPNERKEQKIYLDYVAGTKYPFIVVEGADENCNLIKFFYMRYRYATKVEEPKEVIMTIEEIEKALGVTNLKIVK